MAGGLKQNIWQQLHLISSMVIFLFILMYILSGYMLIKHDWFPEGEPEVTEHTYPVHFELDSSNVDQFYQLMEDRYDLSGRRSEPKVNGNGIWSLELYRPGFAQQLTYNTMVDSVTIKTIDRISLARVLGRLHHIKGFHGGWLYVTWSIMFDLSALALLIFAVSGVVLWWSNRRSLKWGWVFLAAGFIITLIAIGMLW